MFRMKSILLETTNIFLELRPSINEWNLESHMPDMFELLQKKQNEQKTFSSLNFKSDEKKIQFPLCFPSHFPCVTMKLPCSGFRTYGSVVQHRYFCIV